MAVGPCEAAAVEESAARVELEAASAAWAAATEESGGAAESSPAAGSVDSSDRAATAGSADMAATAMVSTRSTTAIAGCTVTAATGRTPVRPWGLTTIPTIWDYGYYPYNYSSYGYGYGYPAAYQPNVTVVYPEQQSAPVAVYSANPVIRRYDEYGQEVGSSGGSGNSSPLYLIAFKDHIIRPALSYSVTGDTLDYVTLDHEDKQVPLDSVDRDLSRQLNRERRVPFSLPGQ